MADTIESFVEKLRSEGVQGGQAAAEKIRAEAEQQAQQTLKQAQTQAEKIVADAKVQADFTLAKYRTELKLAARDTALHLRDTLAQSLQAVLTGPVKQHLSNPDFLGPLLHDIVMQYAQADSARASEIKINVSPDLYKQLADWAISELRKAAEINSTSIDLKGTLAQAGFEYKIAGATIDVTVDSVVETLAELIGPHLCELLNQSTNSSDG